MPVRAMFFLAVFIVMLAAGGFAAHSHTRSERIQVSPNEAEQRVDVIIDGQPFTSTSGRRGSPSPFCFRCAARRVQW